MTDPEAPASATERDPARLLAALDAMTQERDRALADAKFNEEQGRSYADAYNEKVEEANRCRLDASRMGDRALAAEARLARVAALAAQWEEHISGGASPAWEACARALRAALENDRDVSS